MELRDDQRTANPILARVLGALVLAGAAAMVIALLPHDEVKPPAAAVAPPATAASADEPPGLVVRPPATAAFADEPGGPRGRVIRAPAGFVKTTAGVALMYDKRDEAWVKEAVAACRPPRRPVMPSDLAGVLVTNRDVNLALIQKDLGLADDGAITAFYDDKLVAGLGRIEGWAPRIYYMPISSSELKYLVKGGWDCNQFAYNQFSDSLTYDPSYNWPSDRPADESVLPLFYDPDDREQIRVKALTERIEDSETGRMSLIAVMGRQRAVQLYIDMISDAAIKPLGLKRDQEWLGMGIAGVLSAKYVSSLTALDRDLILRQMVSAAESGIAIDLLHPTLAEDLRPSAVDAYNETMRAKAIAVVAKWTGETNDEVMTRALNAVRDKKPVDGAAMLTVIKEATGRDLSRDLSGR